MTRGEEMTALWRQKVPVEQIARKFGVLRPAVYKALRRTGVLPPYEPTGNVRQIVRGLQVSNPIIIPDRTPCFKCGVRADLGCKHQVKYA